MKPICIAVWNAKGGVTKTTLTITLARLWHARGVAVLDLDWQRATRFHTALFNEMGISRTEVESGDFFDGDLPQAPVRLIDCPNDFQACIGALQSADLVLMPFTDAGNSWDVTEGAWRDIHSLAEHGRVLGVMAKYLPRSVSSRSALAQGRELMQGQLAKTLIFSREAVKEADARRLTILDTAPESLAAKQVRALGAEIDALLTTLDVTTLDVTTLEARDVTHA